ncbi:PREDICTED: anaphase-promoting complex subunit 11 [Condylura cristata]|uniref:anaphase-promoting complex subunit 11 n=1 Tax=Condylura cristata TaxID=143302 RepID=UPI000643ACD3|nr:PREDICTED: anaphase-promoting complex subunit 11 [Condylura cristata]
MAGGSTSRQRVLDSAAPRLAFSEPSAELPRGRRGGEQGPDAGHPAQALRCCGHLRRQSGLPYAVSSTAGPHSPLVLATPVPRAGPPIPIGPFRGAPSRSRRPGDRATCSVGGRRRPGLSGTELRGQRGGRRGPPRSTRAAAPLGDGPGLLEAGRGTRALCAGVPAASDRLTPPAGKVPGDDCPLVWGQCSHCFHMHCILKWLNAQQVQQHCPMCRQEWKFRE